jgi:hypothetical protein
LCDARKLEEVDESDGTLRAGSYAQWLECVAPLPLRPSRVTIAELPKHKRHRSRLLTGGLTSHYVHSAN